MTASAVASPRDALMPRQPKGMGAGLVLALIAHALLVLALAFGVNWRASEPKGIEAELWASTPQAAAPRATAPEPQPTPPPAPDVKPTPAPPPKPPEPVAKPEPAPKVVLPDPQIAIEKARREEAKRAQEREDEAERQKAKRDQEKREQDKREQEKRDQAKLDQQKREQAQREQDKRDDAQRAKEAAAKERADDAKREAARQANLRRMMGQAGATGDAAATGTAARSAGPSAGYAGRIVARVKPNILFADAVGGNPVATVEVRVAPDGTITGKRLVRGSGVKAWDDAVLRAIDKTEVLPRDVDGRVPPTIEISFRPND